MDLNFSADFYFLRTSIKYNNVARTSNMLLNTRWWAKRKCGSFHAKSRQSSENLNQAYFDFSETCCSCWCWWHNKNSQIVGQSEEGVWSYGPPNLVVFVKRGVVAFLGSFLPPGTSPTIFTKQVSLGRKFTEDSKSFRRVVHILVTLINKILYYKIRITWEI